MQLWTARLRLLACGGVTLGVLQAIQSIDLNQLWFMLWNMILNWFVIRLLGGDPGTLLGNGAGSPFGSFFL